MKIESDSRQQARGLRQSSAQPSAGQTAAQSDFENLRQRLIAYKPEHQFKVLSARLKAHQVRLRNARLAKEQVPHGLDESSPRACLRIASTAW